MSGEKSRVVTAIVIGAGNRGHTYATFALEQPERFKIVGVADPRKFARDTIQREHGLADDQVFTDWQQVAALEKFADCVIIATLENIRKGPAVAFANKGYHILLEKPMAVTAEDCVEIVETCRKNNTMLAVCHVLRYMPQAKTIKEMISSGVIGDLVNIQLLEPIGFWHFAHSYVRGNWGREAAQSFSLLAKSCHDIDLINYWTTPTSCQRVSSFGSLRHFSSEKKPAGAGSRCLDCGIEASCPYSAKKFYIEEWVKKGRTGWPVKVLADVPDIENVTKALQDGPYGRCVYECDNDVMDNQVVNMQFSGGATASFTMVAFSELICVRQAKIFGSKGEINCSFDGPVYHYDFHTQEKTPHYPESTAPGSSKLSGHGGADYHTMDAFVSAVQTNDPSKILTGAEETLRSHLLTFAAEQARKEDRVINLEKEPLYKQS